jgi:hypothetical protein
MFEDVYWMHLAQDTVQWQAFVNIVMNFQVAERQINFMTSWVTISFPKRTLLHGVSIIIKVGGHLGVWVDDTVKVLVKLLGWIYFQI